MLWGFPLVALILSWLCLLHAAAATIVEDTDPSIHFDNTWLMDYNGDNSGGTAHHTNISGATATYSFTGEFGPRDACLCTLLNALYYE